MNELNKSETGRAIRSDSLESKYGLDFLKDLIIKYYVEERLSSTDAASVLREKHNIPISADKFWKLSKKLGIVRNKSEATSLKKRVISYDSIINDDLKSIIDGMLMGDGSITIYENTKVGRLSIGSVHKEFAQYCSNLLKPYGASEPHFNSGEKGKGMWSTRTFSHPDFYEQRQRWYPNGKKDIPSDIIFNKMFLTLWYLGDGCLSGGNGEENSRYLYFATQGFPEKSLQDIVIPKFNSIGIETRGVSKENCVGISAKSFWTLLKLMGSESPVRCFDYKFDLEDWRKLPGMHEVCEIVNISYQRLSYWVKIGVVEHSRSPGGKKVVFTENEISALKYRIDSGELPRESGKHAHREVTGYGLNNSIKSLKGITGDSRFSDFVVNVLKNKSGQDLAQSLKNKEMIAVLGESEDDFLERVVDTYQRSGFPFPIIDSDKKLKLWQRVLKTMSPELSDDIKWRSVGTMLASSYHPHIYDLNMKGKNSPMKTYKDKSLFKKEIKRYKDDGGRLTYGGVLLSICGFGGSCKVSNYSPLIARDIINFYGFNNMKIIDPCAGFSSRLIGASASRNNCVYTGIEPSTKTLLGLYDTQRFLLEANPSFLSTIMSGCAEDVLKTICNDVYDMCFTCPPYFDNEFYSDESNQSINKYKTYDLWLDGFIKVMLYEVFRVLKHGSKAIFQVGFIQNQNFKDDFIKLAKECGFELYKIHPVLFNYLSFKGKDCFQEDLLVFSKT